MPHIHPELLTRRKGPKFQNVLPKALPATPTKASKKVTVVPPSPPAKGKPGKAAKVTRPPKVILIAARILHHVQKYFMFYCIKMLVALMLAFVL